MYVESKEVTLSICHVHHTHFATFVHHTCFVMSHSASMMSFVEIIKIFTVLRIFFTLI